MKRSLFGCFGFFGSNRIWPKNSAAMMSAAEQEDDGCPLPACVVAAMERMRNWLAMAVSCSIRSWFMASLFWRNVAVNLRKESRDFGARRPVLCPRGFILDAPDGDSRLTALCQAQRHRRPGKSTCAAPT